MDTFQSFNIWCRSKQMTDFEHVELSFCEILMNFDGSCDAVASLNEPIQLGLVLRGVADPIWGDEDP